MTKPTDPITLTREIVEELIVLLVDIGGTSAIMDANASTDNIVRLLRALLAEPKYTPPSDADKCGVCGGTGKAAGYHDVDHYYRDADGAADALTRHGIRDDVLANPIAATDEERGHWPAHIVELMRGRNVLTVALDLVGGVRGANDLCLSECANAMTVLEWYLKKWEPSDCAFDKAAHDCITTAHALAEERWADAERHTPRENA